MTEQMKMMVKDASKAAGSSLWNMVNKLYKLALLFVAFLLGYAVIEVKDANMAQVMSDLFWKVFGFFSGGGILKTGIEAWKDVKKNGSNGSSDKNNLVGG